MADDEKVVATPAIVEAISRHLGDGVDLTHEHITLVLQAWNDLREGAPLGAIIRDPQTGAIAHRVSDGGRHLWRVSSPSGDQWNDLSPMISGWEILHEGG